MRAMAAGALASGGAQCSRAESSQLGREGQCVQCNACSECSAASAASRGVALRCARGTRNCTCTLVRPRGGDVRTPEVLPTVRATWKFQRRSALLPLSGDHDTTGLQTLSANADIEILVKEAPAPPGTHARTHDCTHVGGMLMRWPR